ncbi:hypothetical protein HPB50_001012 [Hyalomma asiaticum]|uniref:Uncharacterized protein n=1 Tax=Hyalomma asiaticum TaxID=266040 RepID=A0ACB7SFC1_HYAAI|nr:hypothetical protein HPB50_001012 [Hyalomma asiaticum]
MCKSDRVNAGGPPDKSTVLASLSSRGSVFGVAWTEDINLLWPVSSRTRTGGTLAGCPKSCKRRAAGQRFHAAANCPYAACRDEFVHEFTDDPPEPADVRLMDELCVEDFLTRPRWRCCRPVAVYSSPHSIIDTHARRKTFTTNFEKTSNSGDIRPAVCDLLMMTSFACATFGSLRLLTITAHESDIHVAALAVLPTFPEITSNSGDTDYGPAVCYLPMTSFACATFGSYLLPVAAHENINHVAACCSTYVPENVEQWTQIMAPLCGLLAENDSLRLYFDSHVFSFVVPQNIGLARASITRGIASRATTSSLNLLLWASQHRFEASEARSTLSESKVGDDSNH